MAAALVVRKADEAAAADMVPRAKAKQDSPTAVFSTATSTSYLWQGALVVPGVTLSWLAQLGLAAEVEAE
jgi:hypothetical protein